MNCNRKDLLTEEDLLLILLKRALKRKQNVKSFSVKSEKSVSFAGGVPELKKTVTISDLPPLSPRKSPEVSGMVAPLSSLSRSSSPLPPLTPRKSPLPELKKSPTLSRSSSPLPPLTPRKSPLPPLTPRKSPLPPLTPRKSPLPELNKSPMLNASDYQLQTLNNTKTSLSPIPLKKKLPPLSKLTAL